MTASIGTVLNEAARTLQANGINEPRLDAGLLISHVIGRDRGFVVAHPEAAITEQQLKHFEEFVARRAAGEPLQYITGHQEFFKLDFEVTADVLIPRPETELLVEIALRLAADLEAPFLCDVGTGSGCIAITLLHELPEISGARAVAVDISPAALAVAKR